MKKLFSFLLLLLCTHAATAQPAATGRHTITPSALQALDSLFRYLETSGLYNGNILVAAGGQPVRQASIGYARLETKERLTDASVFELASVSKQFTAVGVLKLVTDGKIKLDQKVETILPGFPYTGVTVRQLLNHTGGLPDYMALFGQHWDTSKIAVNKDIMLLLAKHKPAVRFAPGEKWEYSNTGYALLAAIIEQVSGKSFAAYMKQQVFDPLGLKQTFIYSRRLTPRTIPGYAFGYVKNNAGGYDLPDRIPDYAMVRYLDGIQGDGTVNTTTGDLLRWTNAVQQRKLLPAALWQEALTPVQVGGKSADYGFGWAVVQHPERGKVLRHTGGWPGYTTSVTHYLDKEVVLAYLGNKELDGALTQGVYDAVRNIVFGQPYTFPAERKAAEIDKQLYELYIGSYESAERQGFVIDITVAEGQLFAQATGQGKIPLQPESSTRFFVPDLPIGMEFKGAAGAKAETLILHQNGQHAFKRK